MGDIGSAASAAAVKIYQTIGRLFVVLVEGYDHRKRAGVGGSGQPGPSATTKITAEKKVTNRYLFAIEDPFETDHNVARTVTHRGIVAIRDEFRRAWRILKAIGQDTEPEGGIFDEVVEQPPIPKPEEVQKGNIENLGVDRETKGEGVHQTIGV